MNASSVYRRQDVMREICRRIGYQGRFVWLISTPEVQLLAHKCTGPSRLRFRMLDITKEPYSFKRFIMRDTKPIRLDHDSVMCALPTLRGRRRDLLVFMHPRAIGMTEWSYASDSKLSPEEMAVCRGQNNFDPSTMAVARAVCIYRGLIHENWNLTTRGAKLLALKHKV